MAGLPESRFAVWRGLELVAVLTISVSAAGLFAMRLGIFQAWQIWIFAFLCAFAYLKLTRADEQPLVSGPPVWHLVLVVAVALFFRISPYAFQLGGQDEGIYTNMAAHLMRTGGLQPFDAVLAGISTTDVRDAYLQGNYQPSQYLPGIYAVNGSLEFQFYHVFPVWLAMFGAIVGAEHMGYALTFLSLVSLLFFQRLAHAITDSPKAGLIAGLLLAVNPLHAFFSKFPVTEIPTLAFSTISFTFLVLYWRAPVGESRARYIVVSLAALAMLFMTRISGFMYFPLLLGVLFLGLLPERSSAKGQGLVMWAMLAIASYALSVIYGLKWSGTYSKDIYALSFEQFLGKHWAGMLVSVALAITVCWFAAWIFAWNERRQAIGRHIAGHLQPVLPAAVLLITALALWKAYKLGFTDAYADHPRYGRDFQLSNKGFRSVRSVSLIASVFYFSPLMLFAFYAACIKRRFSAVVVVLLMFVCSFYAHIAVLQWVLPYQPYYARYLASEFVPYLILFVVVVWTSMEPGAMRRFITFALVFSGFWMTGLSIQQVGKYEHDGVAKSLTRLASHFDPKDVVFLDASLARPAVQEIKTALEYTYGLNVVTATREDVGGTGYAHRLAKRYHDVFYVSRNPLAPEGFTEVDSTDFVEKAYCRRASPPVELCVRSDSRLIVYKRTVVPPPPPGSTALEFSAASPEVRTQVGTLRGGTLVADGRSGFVMYGPYQPLGAGKYSIYVAGSSSTQFMLDISAKKGSERIFSHLYAGAQDPASQVLARIDFELKDSVSDLEVRIHVQAESDIQISGYRILYR